MSSQAIIYSAIRVKFPRTGTISLINSSNRNNIFHQAAAGSTYRIKIGRGSHVCRLSTLPALMPVLFIIIIPSVQAAQPSLARPDHRKLTHSSVYSLGSSPLQSYPIDGHPYAVGTYAELDGQGCAGLNELGVICDGDCTDKKACGELCTANPSCVSWEWRSSTQTACQLSSRCQPCRVV